MNKFIPVNEPLLDGNEKKYLNECIDTGWISSEGPFIYKFEEKFAEKVGRKYAISVTNGTAAIDVAVSALGIEKGDEVIVPSFTIISCLMQIVRLGAIPVLVDSDSSTWNIDVGKIEEKITKKTKAILVVHIYGLPVDMNPVLEIAKKYNLKVIEDAAEELGQTYLNKPCGSFGDVSTFSFYPNKHLTTGEGGMVVTDSSEIAENCRELRNLCFQEGKRRFLHNRLGWNLRMTNLQAAVGLAQLERLSEFTQIKRQIGRSYQELLADCRAIQLPADATNYAENIYWVFGIVLSSEINLEAAELIKKLGEKRVGARPFFWPMNKQPVFNQMGLFKNESHPVAENLALKGLYLPSGLALKKEQQIEVADKLKEILKGY